VIEKNAVLGIVCGKYIEERGVDLFNSVCKGNFKGNCCEEKEWNVFDRFWLVENLEIHTTRSLTGDMHCSTPSRRNKKHSRRFQKSRLFDPAL
jgi:hypothetical protein